MFNRCSRPILWLAKDAGNFVFNEHVPEIRRESDRQAIDGDRRAEEADGKLWDDVWGVDRPSASSSATAKERMPDFPTQLPIALLRPIVACASRPGDLVVDPFSGSGTTGAACIELGRRFVGLELSENFADLSRLRLAAHEKDHAHAEALDEELRAAGCRTDVEAFRGVVGEMFTDVFGNWTERRPALPAEGGIRYCNLIREVVLCDAVDDYVILRTLTNLRKASADEGRPNGRRRLSHEGTRAATRVRPRMAFNLPRQAASFRPCNRDRPGRRIRDR